MYKIESTGDLYSDILIRGMRESCDMTVILRNLGSLRFIFVMVDDKRSNSIC